MFHSCSILQIHVPFMFHFWIYVPFMFHSCSISQICLSLLISNSHPHTPNTLPTHPTWGVGARGLRGGVFGVCGGKLEMIRLGNIFVFGVNLFRNLGLGRIHFGILGFGQQELTCYFLLLGHYVCFGSPNCPK